METIGDRIKKAREGLPSEMKAVDLAKAVGVSKEAVSQWESGAIKNIKPENLIKCADVLGVSIRWLVFGGNDPHMSDDLKSKTSTDNIWTESLKDANQVYEDAETTLNTVIELIDGFIVLPADQRKKLVTSALKKVFSGEIKPSPGDIRAYLFKQLASRKF